MTKIVVHSYEKLTSKLMVKKTTNCLSWYILCMKLIVWSCSQLYRPSDRGGGGHPDPDIRRGGLKKIFSRPFGPQFGLKLRGEPGPPEPLPWIRHCGREMYKNVKRTCKACYSVSRVLLSEKLSVCFQIKGLTLTRGSKKKSSVQKFVRPV